MIEYVCTNICISSTLTQPCVSYKFESAGCTKVEKPSIMAVDKRAIAFFWCYRIYSRHRTVNSCLFRHHLFDGNLSIEIKIVIIPYFQLQCFKYQYRVAGLSRSLLPNLLRRASSLSRPPVEGKLNTFGRAYCAERYYCLWRNRSPKKIGFLILSLLLGKKKLHKLIRQSEA